MGAQDVPKLAIPAPPGGKHSDVTPRYMRPKAADLHGSATDAEVVHATFRPTFQSLRTTDFPGGSKTSLALSKEGPETARRRGEKGDQTARSRQSLDSARRSAAGPSTFDPPAGARIPSERSPLSDAFSTFTYEASEFDRPHQLAVAQMKEAAEKRRRMAKEGEFAYRRPPAPVMGEMAFGRIAYYEDPYEAAELLQREGLRAAREAVRRPFVAGSEGDAGSPAMQARIRVGEAVARLERSFRADWGEALAGVAEEQPGGCILAAFHAPRASPGLAAYMAQQARIHPAVAEFHLRKEGARWGALSESRDFVLYSFVPPWARTSRASPPAPAPAPATSTSSEAGTPRSGGPEEPEARPQRALMARAEAALAEGGYTDALHGLRLSALPLTRKAAPRERPAPRVYTTVQRTALPAAIPPTARSERLAFPRWGELNKLVEVAGPGGTLSVI
eukprot:tig00021127_g18867.t1